MDLVSRRNKKQKERPVERVYMCDKCGSFLWTLKILSHFSDGTIGASKWISHHPEQYEGGPKGWDCPLCHKPWAEMHYNPQTKQEVRRVKVVDPDTGKWSFVIM